MPKPKASTALCQEEQISNKNIALSIAKLNCQSRGAIASYEDSPAINLVGKAYDEPLQAKDKPPLPRSNSRLCKYPLLHSFPSHRAQ